MINADTKISVTAKGWTTSCVSSCACRVKNLRSTSFANWSRASTPRTSSWKRTKATASSASSPPNTSANGSCRNTAKRGLPSRRSNRWCSSCRLSYPRCWLGFCLIRSILAFVLRFGAICFSRNRFLLLIMRFWPFFRSHLKKF